MANIKDHLPFITQLRRCFNDADVEKIAAAFVEPITGANINRRTGRERMGAPRVLPRKILNPSSLVNYKSVILKFAKFKLGKVGRAAPLDATVTRNYDQLVLGAGGVRHQTALTNWRVLNKYVVYPLLKLEMPKPRLITTNGGDRYNNKPQLTHDEVAETLRYIWRSCKNRDHVLKMFLIYYTGLRSAEAGALTFRDLLEGWHESSIILGVRRGKGHCDRRVMLFKGAPTSFFLNHLIPHLKMKANHLVTREGLAPEDILDRTVFCGSTYQAAQKVFRKALIEITQRNNDFDVADDLKGAGLHSIRADYSTRMMQLLFHHYNGNTYLAMMTLSNMMGHKGEKMILRHYVNLGNVNNNNNNTTSEHDSVTKYKTYIYDKLQEEAEEGRNDHSHDIAHIFKDAVKIGNKANDLLKNNRRQRNNLNNILGVTDPNYIVPKSVVNKKDNLFDSIVYV